MLKYFSVFNIEDIEGIKIEIPEVKLKEHERIEKCEAIIKGMQNPPKFVFAESQFRQTKLHNASGFQSVHA